MTFFTKLAMKSAGRKAAARFEVATRDPRAMQLRKLLEIVERNKDTEYGREFGFDGIRDFAGWRRRVPVITYETIRERVERVTKGERNVLTQEDPVMFAQTSGTTGKPKYVPVTPTCRGRDHSDQMRTWLYHADKDHSRVFNGKVLSLVSPAVEGYTEAKIPYGSTSGHIYKNLPWLIRSTYSIPYDVFEIEDYETNDYVIMRIGVGANISFLCTANPSSVLKMCEVAETSAESILRDIRDGTLTVAKDLGLDPEKQAAIRAACPKDPEKVKRLEAAMKRRNGRLLPGDYWPNLALIGCWKGGTVGDKVERFPKLFDPDGTRPVPVRDWGYLSSEARCSIPLSDHGSGGVLTVGTNVYEFVEVSELESNPDEWGSWTFLDVGELAVGKEYYIFVTTTGGLYRYDINDIIAIVGKHNATPIIEFRRKGRGVTNITGEKVSVNQVIEAIQRASRELELDIDHFKAEADHDDSRYVFLVESRTGIPEESRRSFLERLDAILKELNIEYDAKRKSQRLKTPVLQLMRPGWHESIRRGEITQKGRDFQRKTIKLSARDAKSVTFVEATVTLED